MVMALVGCATYTASPIDVDRLPAAYARRSLDEPALRQFATAFLGSKPAEWPPAALDLATLQAIALFDRPELQAARAHLAGTSAAHAVVAELGNPRLAIGPGVVANPGSANQWLATVGLLFPLDLSGQRGARMEAAASEVNAARVGVLRADQAIRIEVVAGGFAVVLRQQLDALAEDQARLRWELVALAEKRANVGAADAIEVDRARSNAQRAAVVRAAFARETEAAHAALAAALGLPPAALDARRVRLPVATLPELDGATQERLATAAMRNRLDVAEALCSYARSEALLRLEVARQWPDFELGPGYEYDQGLHKYRVDIGFTLPLFHGNGAAIEKATADRASAAVAVEAVQTRVITEVESALQQFARQRQELDAAQVLAATTATAVAKAVRRTALGADDQGAVIAARIDDIEARAALVQQEHRAREAWLRLEVTLQQPIGEGLLAWQHAVPERVQ